MVFKSQKPISTNKINGQIFQFTWMLVARTWTMNWVMFTTKEFPPEHFVSNMSVCVSKSRDNEIIFEYLSDQVHRIYKRKERKDFVQFGRHFIAMLQWILRLPSISIIITVNNLGPWNWINSTISFTDVSKVTDKAKMAYGVYAV